jgi:hypothetical protein
MQLYFRPLFKIFRIAQILGELGAMSTGLRRFSLDGPVSITKGSRFSGCNEYCVLDFFILYSFFFVRIVKTNMGKGVLIILQSLDNFSTGSTENISFFSSFIGGAEFIFTFSITVILFFVSMFVEFAFIHIF